MNALTMLAVAITVLAAGLVVWLAGRTVLRMRGQRLITCPENHQTAAVDLDVPHATIAALKGHHDLRLADCSRWPEKAGCGQECLVQIEAGPENCLVRRMVAAWYADKRCVFCGKDFGEIHWHDHPPALREADGRTVQWTDVPAETLPRQFETARPVCWNCHVAESFRREHPDLVVDRPARPHAH